MTPSQIASALSEIALSRINGRTPGSQRLGYQILKEAGVPANRLAGLRNASLEKIEQALSGMIPEPDMRKAVRAIPKFTPAKKFYFKTNPVDYIYVLSYRVAGDNERHFGTLIDGSKLKDAVVKQTFFERFGELHNQDLLYGTLSGKIVKSSIKIESREEMTDKRRSELKEQYNKSLEPKKKRG